MKKGNVLEEILAAIVILILVFGYMPYFFSHNKPLLLTGEDIKHDTNRWVLIIDKEGSRLAVETKNDTIWEWFLANYQEHEDQGTNMVIVCSKVVSYDNSWHFRMDPESIRFYYGLIKGETHTIKQIANDLDYYLNEHTSYIAFYLNSIDFYNTKKGFNTESIFIAALLINIIQIIIIIPLFSLYFVIRREKEDYENLEEALKVAETFPNGVTYLHIRQRTGLKQKRIEKLIEKSDLREVYIKKIKDETLQSKDVKYKNKSNQIDKQFKEIIQLTPDKFTPEKFSALFRIRKDLEEILEYYKDIYNKNQEYKVESKIEMITELIDFIKLEDLN